METAPIKLAPEQERALELMLSGKNVFLTGEAGMGKSTILREFREKCTRECVFLAPTGIAAINVGGATLHSFFQLKPGLLTPDSLEEIGNKSRRALIRKVKTIVIDEISMVRSDVFDAIDRRLRSLARGSNGLRPFGGKQIILVGDFFQLPPVVKSETEDEYLRKVLGGYYAFQTLSQALHLDRSAVAKKLALANLCPEVIEAVFSGTAPESLTLKKVMYGFPDDWEEQKRMFGME